MNRFLWLAFGLASLAATPAMAVTAAANATAGKAVKAAAIDKAPASRLSAAQIVDRNVAARGGLQAWRAIGSVSMTGKIDAGGKKETALPFVMTMKRPHKSRFELRFQEQTAVQVYDGTQGWKVRPFLGRDEVEPYTPAEARSAATLADLDGPLIDYAAKGTTVELLGMEPVEGHSAYKLKLTMKDHVQRRMWIDAKSFLELKIDGEPRKLDGRMHNVAIYYRDYKTENGLTVPYLMETVVEGAKASHKISIQRVTLNPPADDAMFAKPQLTVAKVSSQ
ncbi:outer membrane lipoprotein-sorting protein [Collimonas sp. PA-H2]|uniref:outer membrane lipoprotein-sorting protein n=1 Tax=Collimonas sp. PA-H2 TaxID=1881062 RepID=UPI000BF64D7F|nr:outer membrane lipoprotein-sorting protein [Collimonas sp. PA-H2]PFH08597.1 outer membrane lipoprotein-sorting protein [Collimonas sp. PA-H2]